MWWFLGCCLAEQDHLVYKWYGSCIYFHFNGNAAVEILVIMLTGVEWQARSKLYEGFREIPNEDVKYQTVFRSQFFRVCVTSPWGQGNKELNINTSVESKIDDFSYKINCKNTLTCFYSISASFVQFFHFLRVALSDSISVFSTIKRDLCKSTYQRLTM